MFSRGSRTSGRHARADRSRREQRTPSRSLAAEMGVADEGSTAGEAEPADQPADPAPAAEQPTGPYDVSEAPPAVKRLDLGSLQIPMVSGVEVRVQPGKEGAVQQVFLVHGESTVQLGIFAAPRTEPIWDEVRGEIRKSLFDDGVAAEEIDGEHGIELRARVRTQDGLMDLRFVGVDGQRWMVRAVYRGPAAVDPAQAGPLAECLRGLVVDRGTEPRPVKEPLPLRLPKELADKLPEGAQGVRLAAGTPPGAQPPGAQPPGAQPPDAQPPGAQPPGAQRAAGEPASNGAAPKRRKPSPRPRRSGTG